VLLRHALGQAVATLAVGVGGGHVDAEAVAGHVAFERLVQARDDVAVAGEDRQRIALLRRLQRLLARLGHGVMETHDAVFLDLQGFGAHGALVAGRRADARRAVACQRCGDSAKMRAVMEAAHYPGSPAAAPTWRLPAFALALLAGLLAGGGHEPAR